MGKGLLDNEGNSFERKTSTHGMPVGEAGGSFEKSLSNLGGNLADPFTVFEDVQRTLSEIFLMKRERLLRSGREGKVNGHQKTVTWIRNFICSIPVRSLRSISERSAEGRIQPQGLHLQPFWDVLASKIENMIVASADLSNSDKTDGFLKNTKQFVKG